ncbi:nucleotidyl transferase [Candidatus Gracilibacteria bacterium]|nr:nucleotidyl transferase [Candidatus Gracilibacteria bacterium]
MQILLLATDEQTAPEPLSDTFAAPMVPVVNRPVMATAIEVLARAGHKKIMVALWRRGGSVAAYFGSGQRWGVQLEYVTLREALGSAGALKWAGNLISETTLVLPASTVLDLDIEAALAFHRAHGGPLTLIAHASRGDVPHLPLEVNEHGLLESKADDASCLSYTGAYIAEPAVLDLIPARRATDLYADMVPALLRQESAVHVYLCTSYWNPLVSLDAYQEAQEVFLYSAYNAGRGDQPELRVDLPQVRYPSIEGRQIAPGIWVGHDPLIHPAARLAAPVVIGNNSWIGRDVELGRGVVLGPNVIVDDEATVSESTVLASSYVGQLVNVHRRVVNQAAMGDPATGETIRVTDPFLLSRATPHFEQNGSRLKRTLSSFVAVVVLLVLSPLLLLIALLSLILNGRIFEPAERISYRRTGPDQPVEAQPFRLWRFATSRRDGTSTAYGRVLRRMEFERWPELLNILGGDLALVGVKPLTIAEDATLLEEWQQRRREAPVGFTGLWYTQCPPDADLDNILVADAYYAATRNWREDLRLCLKTPLSWLRRRRARSAAQSSSTDYMLSEESIA